MQANPCGKVVGSTDNFLLAPVCKLPIKRLNPTHSASQSSIQTASLKASPCSADLGVLCWGGRWQKRWGLTPDKLAVGRTPVLLAACSCPRSNPDPSTALPCGKVVGSTVMLLLAPIGKWPPKKMLVGCTT